MSEEAPKTNTPFLDEKTWNLLVKRVDGGQCTPILGPELTLEESALVARTATDWARETAFPFEQPRDLPWVAESLALAVDIDEPRDRLADLFRDLQAEHPEVLEVYRLLAELPLPLYICTTYHSYLTVEIDKHQLREPRVQIIRWQPGLDLVAMPGDPLQEALNKDLIGSVQSPVVLHLYGQAGEHMKGSMVLTERDFMDFLHAVASDSELIPPTVDAALANTYLLFLGYRLVDLQFQVLMRTLKEKLEHNRFRDRHIAVQFVDIGDEDQRRRAEEYLKDYLAQDSITVVPGLPVEFVRELHARSEFAKVR